MHSNLGKLASWENKLQSLGQLTGSAGGAFLGNSRLGHWGGVGASLGGGKALSGLGRVVGRELDFMRDRPPPRMGRTAMNLLPSGTDFLRATAGTNLLNRKRTDDQGKEQPDNLMDMYNKAKGVYTIFNPGMKHGSAIRQLMQIEPSPIGMLCGKPLEPMKLAELTEKQAILTAIGDAALGVGRGIYDIGTATRRGFENANNALSYFNPFASHHRMALRNARSAEQAGDRIDALQRQRQFMQDSMGDQFGARQSAGIDREIARLQKDQQRWGNTDQALSANAMAWSQFNPARRMEMMKERQERIGFEANDHFATGHQVAPTANHQFAPARNQSTGVVSAKQHAQNVRAGIPTQQQRANAQAAGSVPSI